VRVLTRVTVSLAIVLAGITTLPAWRSIPWVTTYGATSPIAMVAQFAAGLGLIAAGLLWAVDRSTERTGLLLALAGTAWFMPVWIGWQNGPAGIRTAAMLIQPVFLPLVCHIVVSVCGGRKRLRLAIALLYLLAAALTFALLLVTDPLTDPGCWNNCTINVLLVTSQPPLARMLAGTWTAVSVAAGLTLAAGTLWHLLAATRTARRLTWLVTVPASVLGVSLAAHGIALTATPPENPNDPLYAAIFQLEAWSVVALAAGAASGLLRARWARRALTNLATELGAAPKPGSLAPVLARATGDPTLEVAYWLPDSRRFVNGFGEEVLLPARHSRRAIAQIIRGGESIAAINHDPALVDPSGLVQAIGPAARVAIDNERLQAELLAQLAELQASQVRVVQTSDAERRRLERNLHDAAQQAVLALSYDIRIAVASAQGSGGHDLRQLLERAMTAVQSAVEELRQLAHGIYPSELSDFGLRPALASLADTASVRVAIGSVPSERLPPIVERTAYLAAADVIDQAVSAGADELTIAAEAADGDLVVEIRGTDVRPTTPTSDRVRALGGQIVRTSRTLRVRIPCA
jgi:signal transduction histidine kinase